MLHLHVSYASCLYVENVHVVQALSRLPLCDWGGFAHLNEFHKMSCRILFAVTTLTGKMFRVHEIIEIFIASSEIKLKAAFLAATQEDAI